MEMLWLAEQYWDLDPALVARIDGLHDLEFSRSNLRMMKHRVCSRVLVAKSVRFCVIISGENNPASWPHGRDGGFKNASECFER